MKQHALLLVLGLISLLSFQNCGPDGSDTHYSDSSSTQTQSTPIVTVAPTATPTPVSSSTPRPFTTPTATPTPTPTATPMIYFPRKLQFSVSPNNCGACFPQTFATSGYTTLFVQGLKNISAVNREIALQYQKYYPLDVTAQFDPPLADDDISHLSSSSITCDSPDAAAAIVSFNRNSVTVEVEGSQAPAGTKCMLVIVP